MTRREYARGDYAQLKQQRPEAGRGDCVHEPSDFAGHTDSNGWQDQGTGVEVTGSQTGTVAKAKAAYDYLFTNMRYDKTGSGWGRGDAVWACDAKHGNCTDFHSPFIGMLRADGIPARFDIGFPLPGEQGQRRYSWLSLLGGILCPKTGWIPVDISEAWKAEAERKIISSAVVDANRVQFSTGRDITLVSEAGWASPQLLRLPICRG